MNTPPPHRIEPEITREQLINALRELELCTRQYLAGQLVTMPAALLPQVRAIVARAEETSR